MIAYVAHPVGGTNGHEMVEQAENVYNAGRWWRFIHTHTTWCVIMSWQTHHVFGYGWAGRDRAIDDQIEIVTEAADILVLTGEYISAYMEALRERAYLHKIPILNLTDLGDHVPEHMSRDEGREMMRNRAAILGVRTDIKYKELNYDRRRYALDPAFPGRRDPVEES